MMWKPCLGVAATLVPGAALACAVMSPFNLSALSRADPEVVGEVTACVALSDPDGENWMVPADEPAVFEAPQVLE